MPDYFLISVSNKENLEICLDRSLAGFTGSMNGVWAFWDISEGDYVSFLFAARARNLYEVKRKVAVKNSEENSPWPSIVLRSGRKYNFPFRLILSPVRKFNEPLVRQEFAFVAENLLLRGGYRKTHFQADTSTLYSASQMGERVSEERKEISLSEDLLFEPKITFKKGRENPPYVYRFHELILQALIRKKLKLSYLNQLLKELELPYSFSNFDVIGEKALPEGYVDLFLKQKHPVGTDSYILIEVKTGKASRKDFEQLQKYLSYVEGEAKAAILVARDFPKSFKDYISSPLIKAYRYSFDSISLAKLYTFDELVEKLTLTYAGGV